MALGHFFIQSFEGGLKHGDSVSERLLGLLEVLLDKNSSKYFPTFPGPGKWVEVGEDEIVLSSLFFEFDVSFEDLCVFLFDFIVVLGDFLWHRHVVIEVIII